MDFNKISLHNQGICLEVGRKGAHIQLPYSEYH